MVNRLNTISLSRTFCCRDVISYLLWFCQRVQSCRYFDGFKMVCETRQVDRTVYVTVLVWVVLWEVIFAIFVNLQYIFRAAIANIAHSVLAGNWLSFSSLLQTVDIFCT